MRFPISLLAGVLLLLPHTSTHARQRGVIDDPDGFINLRAAPSATSAVVARVNAGEVFEFIAESTAGNLSNYYWYKVTLRNGKTGWMHYSRIRLHFERSDLKADGPTARLAAKGNRKALRTFFGYHGDGGAAEVHQVVATIVLHLVGDERMAAFISSQPAALHEDPGEFAIVPFEPKEYLFLHFPKTAAALGLRPPKLDPLPCTARLIATHGKDSADDPADQAQFPASVAADPTGNIYVAGSGALRRINPDGAVETVAGALWKYDFVDGAGKDARFSDLCALAIGPDGNIYGIDGTQLRKVTAQGVVTTVTKDLGHDLRGLAVDRAGVIYVADAQACVIRKIERDGTVTLLAGQPGKSETVDGPAKDARFEYPSGIVVAADGTLFVVQRDVIRKIDVHGIVTTLAGNPETSDRDDGQGHAANFEHLTAITIDDRGVLYVADSGSIRQISPSGVVRTLQTTTKERLPLEIPAALTIDPQGRILVVDRGANTVVLVELAH